MQPVPTGATMNDGIPNSVKNIICGAYLNGLKQKKGGRIFLGPTSGDGSQSIYPDLSGKAVETYTPI